MALTFGFYNSLNGDRKYDAIQFGEIFDGIINDGVYQAIGSVFKIEPLSGMQISVGTGRAWFNHTWIKNDSIYPLLLASSHPIYDRYDAVVIEVNSETRTNSINIVQGEPATTPIKPQLNKTNTRQYPIGYIKVPKNAISISKGDIEISVGSKDCPFVTGPLTVLTIDRFMEVWQSEWNQWLNKTKEEYSNTLSNSKSEFDLWFKDLKVNIDSNVAVRLQNQITELNKMLNLIMSGGYATISIEDSNGRPITDNNGLPIYGQRKYLNE